MTRAELVAKVRSEVVDAMLKDVSAEAALIRRELDSGRHDVKRRDVLTREEARIVFDLVDDFIAHCRRWDPK